MLSGDPVPTNVPPQLPEYHLSVVPEPPTAVSETLPVGTPQKVVIELDADVGATGAGFTVTVTEAQFVLTQPVAVLRARPK